MPGLIVPGAPTAVYDDAVRVLGLTGGIGSGTTTVARILQRLGATLVEADQLAREVLAPGEPALEEVRAAFPAAFDADGSLNRGRLAQRVFSDAMARARLNAITHPRIGAHMAARIAAARAQGVAVLVADIPLLFESDRRSLVDTVIVVSVDPATQEERLRARDALSMEAARARIAAQMPLAEKVRRADYVIDNSGDLQATEAQIAALWKRLRLAGP
jgi:dephospho-CoA kinase